MMVLECPHCHARLRARAVAPNSPVRCSKCKEVFQAPPEDPEPVLVPIPEVVPEAVSEVIPQAVPVPDAANESDWSSMADEPAPVEPEKKKSRTQQAPRKFPTVLVACIVVALGAIGAVVAALTLGGDKPKPSATDPAPQTATPPKKDAPKKDKDKLEVVGTTVRPQIPPEYADLFKETAERPAPTLQIPVLKKLRKEELTIPVAAGMQSADPAAGKLTLEEIKKATTYIEVQDGMRGGSGSGFVVQAKAGSVLVATNFHVVSMASGEVSPATRIRVVFDSGLPTERASPAKVIAQDPEIDLALLQVAAPGAAPKPIDPFLAPKPMEAIDVLVCGFPFGASLGVKGRNPNVSIGKSSVSSLRPDETGKLVTVQINGALNPGNSGGPVVDAEGRLVGIAVRSFIGKGIGEAIPAAELAAMLTGRVSPAEIIPTGENAKQAEFQVHVPVADPLHRVTALNLHVWMGDMPPKAEPGPDGAWSVLPGARKIALKLTPEGALGGFGFPVPAGKKPAVLLQLECLRTDGPVVSAPVRYDLVLDGVQTASDAVPIAKLRQELDRYAGQVVAVKGKLAPGKTRRGPLFELQVADESDAVPPGLLFLTDRDVATQLSELPPLERSVLVRLTLRVGKPAAGGVTPARVMQVNFIGRGNRIVRTLPVRDDSANGKLDDLTRLNRAPEQKVGQIVLVIGFLSSAVLGTDKAPELSVLTLMEQRPENLHFTTSPAIAAQLKALALSPDTLYGARLTVRVEPRVVEGTTTQVVTVTKIELADDDGKTGRTLE